MKNSPFANDKGAASVYQYGVARSNLLLTVIFTVINIVLAAVNANVYFLFSAEIPHLFAGIGAAVFYDTEYAVEMGVPEGAQFTVFIVLLAVALVLTVPYFLCWVFSKKHHGWMIAALVLFSIDTVFMLLNFDISLILDILFHVYVMFFLIKGVVNGSKVKKAEEAAKEEALSAMQGDSAYGAEASGETEASAFSAETEEVLPLDTLPLRSAGLTELNGEKVKVYLETVYMDKYKIVYRAVGKKKTEELVINDMVYAEKPRFPMNTSMTAIINGLKIDVGAANSNNIIAVNDEVIARNTRWI